MDSNNAALAYVGKLTERTPLSAYALYCKPDGACMHFSIDSTSRPESRRVAIKLAS